MPHSVRSRRAFAALSSSRDRSRAGPLWITRAAEHPDLGEVVAAGRVEVAFAIGRSVGTAVVRNRLRRQLRVLMDEVVDDGLAPGWYLVGVRPSVTEHTFDDLRRFVRRASAAWRGDGRP